MVSWFKRFTSAHSQRLPGWLPIILMGLIILIIIGIIVLAIFGQTEKTPTAKDSVSPNITQNPVVSIPNQTVAPAGSTEPEPTNSTSTTEPSQPTNNNPAELDNPNNWQNLSLAQKTALNPYNCPIENHQLRFNQTDGSCLDESAVAQLASVSPDLETVNRNHKLSIKFHSTSLSIDKLELQCSIIEQTIKALSKTEDLTSLKEGYKRYITYDSEFINQLYQQHQTRLINAFDYINNLQQYLYTNNPSINKDNIWDYLDRYQDCQVSMQAENIGQDSSFSNLCGLNLDDEVSALDDQNHVYDSQYIGPAFACADAIKPFPKGAKEKTAVYFVLPVNRQISYLIFTDTAQDKKVLVNLNVDQ